MAKKTSKVRLQKELKAFVADPPPFIPRVHVNERNILVGVAQFPGAGAACLTEFQACRPGRIKVFGTLISDEVNE